MIKVLHITNVMQGGGRERRLSQTIKGLESSESINNSLLVLDSSQIAYREIYELGDRLHLVANKSRYNSISDLYRVVKKDKPDIIHCWCMNIILLISLIVLRPFFRFKLISGFVADGCKLPRYGFSRFTTKLSFFVSEKIVSNSMAGLVAKEAPLKKSVVIHNGFDYNRFIPFDIENLKTSLNVRDSFIVTMVARFDNAKDWMSFLKMIQYVNSKPHDNTVKFLAVGKGPSLDYYIEKSKEMCLDNIIFTGFRTDVEQIVRISDICLLFSNDDVHAEGISNSILEAMAAGKIVVATKGGGTPEIIDNTVDGFIIPPSDYIGAGDIILRMMNGTEETSSIGEAAKNKIQKDFLLAGMVNQYKDLYESMI